MDNPPRGIRYYELQNSKAINAGLMSRIAIKLQKLKDNTIKLQIVAAKELMTLADEPSCNPFVECYWSFTNRDSSFSEIPCWQLIWVTAPKGSTTNPSWEAEDGATLFLPPIWSSESVSFFNSVAPDGVHVVENGAWIPKNYDPTIFTAARVRAVLSLIAARQDNGPEISLSNDVLEAQLAQFRQEMMLAENERRKMWEEEESMRSSMLKDFIDKNQGYIDEQRLLGKEFFSLQSSIEEPSKNVARLRFLLAEPLDSGSVLYYCNDPTTGQDVKLYTISLHSTDDEMELRRQITSLINNQPSAVMKILEFTVHSLRGFNSSGFLTFSSRVGLVLAEHNFGVNLEGYVREKWEIMSDEQLRKFLLNVSRGIKQLHSLGILHRNIHTGSFKVIKTNGDESCILEDFWILHNPRNPGYGDSIFRSGWGCPATRPPELNEGRLCDKGDVFAFAVSTYYLATSSNNVMRVNPLTHQTQELLRTLPHRWGTWLHKLLPLCLEPNPSLRFSADDLYLFLASSLDKKDISAS